MNRIATFLLAASLSVPAFGQVPPGSNYDPAKHENPVITYVLSKDFKPSTMKAAEENARISLMGLSKDLGSRQSLDLAEPTDDPSKDLKLPVSAKFYPVVRQTFKLTGGGELTLYSFKAPRIQAFSNGRFGIGGIPGMRRDPKNKRLGPASPPEEIEVRSHRGILFDKDGTLTAAWEEQGTIYVATSKLGRKALFRVLEDLL